MVAQTIHQVTEDYIKQSLTNQYGSGRGWDYSPLLLAKLKKSAEDKQKNLSWLFGDQLRIRITPSPEEVYKDMLNDSEIARNIVEVLGVMGCTVTAEDFIKGFAVYNKQRMRIGKILEDVDKFLDVLPSHIISQYGKRTYSGPQSSKYKEEHRYNIDLGDTVNLGSITLSNQVVIPTASIANSLSKEFHKYHNMETLLNAASSQDLILSLDINDYITCSTQSGSCRSCLRIDGEYHLGWMMHYRSDFSIIMFNHSKDNEFEKTGRAFVQVRLTEGGAPYIKPFYKVGRTYGSINATHRRLANEFIQGKIKEAFGWAKPTNIDTSGDFESTMLSTNMSQSSGNNGGYAGYFDRVIDSNAAFYVYPSDIPAFPRNEKNYRYGPAVIFPFPDALGLDGHATDRANFYSGSNSGRSHLGMIREDVFVTCSKSGEQVLLSDAICISANSFISKSWLLSQVGITDVKEELVVVQEDVPEDQLDVEDF